MTRVCVREQPPGDSLTRFIELWNQDKQPHIEWDDKQYRWVVDNNNNNNNHNRRWSTSPELTKRIAGAVKQNTVVESLVINPIFPHVNLILNALHNHPKLSDLRLDFTGYGGEVLNANLQSLILLLRNHTIMRRLTVLGIAGLMDSSIVGKNVLPLCTVIKECESISRLVVSFPVLPGMFTKLQHLRCLSLRDAFGHFDTLIKIVQALPRPVKIETLILSSRPSLTPSPCTARQARESLTPLFGTLRNVELNGAISTATETWGSLVLALLEAPHLLRIRVLGVGAVTTTTFFSGLSYNQKTAIETVIWQTNAAAEPSVMGAVATAVARSRTLRKFHFTSDYTRTPPYFEGLTETLFDAIKENKTLEDIHVALPRFDSPAHLKYFAETHANHPTLSTIHYRAVVPSLPAGPAAPDDKKMTMTTFTPFIDMITRNRTIHLLCLPDTPFTKATFAEKASITNALRHNGQIASLFQAEDVLQKQYPEWKQCFVTNGKRRVKWIQVCLLLSCLRANRGSPIGTSIMPLIPSIIIQQSFTNNFPVIVATPTTVSNILFNPARLSKFIETKFATAAVVVVSTAESSSASSSSLKRKLSDVVSSS
jgi:hypothetical protein